MKTQNLSLTEDVVITGTSGDDRLYGSKADEVVYGLAGNDTLYTQGGHDTLDGGTGDDYLTGGDGSDDYVFGLGYGHDKIYDTAGQNRVLLDAGITPDDIVLSRTRDGALNLFIKGSADQLEIQYQFDSYYGLTINTIEFADGTVWGKQDFLDRIVTSEAGDLFYGGDGNESINGLGGDDWLYGGAGDDVLDGGDGDDSLAGQAGNDTYLFGLGSGQDEITNSERDGDFDQAVLGSGISVGDVSVARGDDFVFDLVLKINGTDDTLTISDYFRHEGKVVDIIQFADGTQWDHQAILDMVNHATEGDDWLAGSAGADVIDALGGDDRIHGYRDDDDLSGGSGWDDIYGGSGNDVLKGGGDYDELFAGAGDDILVGGAGGDRLHGDEGQDELKGGADWDTLIGGLGNDVLTGGSGSDEFFFGDGINENKNVDIITDFLSGEDTINLDRYTFGKLGPNGTLEEGRFVASETGAAMDADDRILYETDTGNLYYDPDGNGIKDKKLFAIIGQGNHPELAASDFDISG